MLSHRKSSGLYSVSAVGSAYALREHGSDIVLGLLFGEIFSSEQSSPSTELRALTTAPTVTRRHLKRYNRYVAASLLLSCHLQSSKDYLIVISDHAFLSVSAPAVYLRRTHLHAGRRDASPAQRIRQ